MDLAINDGHARFHGWYELQTQKNGAPCCNGKDCRTVIEWDLVPGGARVKIKTGWLEVPNEKIQYKTPDGNAHYCGITQASGKEIIFCLFIPSFA